MNDGIECEVEVDKVLRVSFVHQMGYAFFLKDTVGQAGSTRKETMLVPLEGIVSL